jgi:hypothetical protein
MMTAILAGGLAGQITVAVLTSRFQKQKDFDSWLRQEKIKVYTELLTVVSSYRSLENLDDWPGSIREVSMKIHLLHHSGTATEESAIPGATSCSRMVPIGRLKFDFSGS